MASKLIAIVAGVGPGTGASVARKFAATYPVVLLARKPESYESLAKEINQNGGKAVGISTDVSDSSSVKKAVETIKKEFGDEVGAAVGIIRTKSAPLHANINNRPPSSTPLEGFSEPRSLRYLRIHSTTL